MTTLLLLATLGMAGQHPGLDYSVDSDLPLEHQTVILQAIRSRLFPRGYSGGIIFIDRQGTTYVNRMWLLDGVLDLAPLTSPPNVFEGHGFRIAGVPTRMGFGKRAEPPKEAPTSDDPDTLITQPKAEKPWEPPLADGLGLYYRETLRPSKHDIAFLSSSAPPIKIARAPANRRIENAYFYGSIWSMPKSTNLGDAGWVYVPEENRWFAFIHINGRMLLIRSPMTLRGSGSMNIVLDGPIVVEMAGVERTLAVFSLVWSPLVGPFDSMIVFVEPNPDVQWEKNQLAYSRVSALSQSEAGLSGSSFTDSIWRPGQATEFEFRGWRYWERTVGTHYTGRGWSARPISDLIWQQGHPLVSHQQWPPAEGPERETLGTVRATQLADRRSIRVDIIAKKPEPARATAGGGSR